MVRRSTSLLIFLVSLVVVALYLWCFESSDKKVAGKSVCVIAQTYAGHGSNLKRFMNNFRGLNHPDWRLHVVNTDSTPYPAMHRYIQETNDDRISICGTETQPQPFSYQQMFHLVDASIASCCDPTFSRWLLVTNADNYYEPTVFDHLDEDYEVISFSFHTRNPRIPIAALGCAPGLLQWQEHDLGAIIFDFQKWRHLKMRFAWPNILVRHASLDGCVASIVSWHMPTLQRCFPPSVISQFAKSGYKAWKRHHVMECLLSHNPNPWFKENVKRLEKEIESRVNKRFAAPV